MASLYKFTEKYLNKFGKEIIAEMKTRLSGAGKKATGELSKSLKYTVNKDLTLTYYMNEYGKFVDKGVSGHGIIKGFKGKKKQIAKGQVDKFEGRSYSFKDKMPPESAFKKWLKLKGIDKEKSFVIRRSVWMFGIKPTNFFTLPITRRAKQFEKGLEDSMVMDIDKQLEKELK